MTVLSSAALLSDLFFNSKSKHTSSLHALGLVLSFYARWLAWEAQHCTVNICISAFGVLIQWFSNWRQESLGKCVQKVRWFLGLTPRGWFQKVWGVSRKVPDSSGAHGRWATLRNIRSWTRMFFVHCNELSRDPLAKGYIQVPECCTCQCNLIWK